MVVKLLFDKKKSISRRVPRHPPTYLLGLLEEGIKGIALLGFFFDIFVEVVTLDEEVVTDYSLHGRLRGNPLQAFGEVVLTVIDGDYNLAAVGNSGDDDCRRAILHHKQGGSPVHSLRCPVAVGFPQLFTEGAFDVEGIPSDQVLLELQSILTRLEGVDFRAMILTDLFTHSLANIVGGCHGGGGSNCLNNDICDHDFTL